MIRLAVIYVLAFATGAGAAYGTARLNMMAMFGDLSTIRWQASLILPPLAGISAFALVFGVAMRLSLRMKFWLVSLALTYGLSLIGLSLVYYGYASLLESLVIVLLLLFTSGWLMVLRIAMPEVRK